MSRLALFLILALAGAAFADPGIEEKKLTHNEEDKSRTRELGLNVDRIWSESGMNWAQVTVKNTSVYALDEITIKCTAFGAAHINLSFHEQTLVSKKNGPIVPGFSKTMDLQLGGRGFEIRSMSCVARGW
jgi:hypothetical protein